MMISDLGRSRISAKPNFGEAGKNTEPKKKFFFVGLYYSFVGLYYSFVGLYYMFVGLYYSFVGLYYRFSRPSAREQKPIVGPHTLNSDSWCNFKSLLEVTNSF